MTRPSVLALRASGLGDLLTAVPALRALAMHDVARPVTVAAPAWLHELVRLVPGVHEPVAALGFSIPGVTRPCLAVNLHGRGPQSHRALLHTQPGRLLAYRSAGVWEDGPDWVEHDNERDRWCRLLRWHGIPAEPHLTALSIPPVAAPVPGAVVLHVGGKDPRRRWSVQGLAAVAATLAADGERVVITGAEVDRRRATAVAARSGLPRSAVVAGRLSLTELAALVARARLVLCGDTGVGHLASAYGTPSVLVFGPESPQQWGPPPRPQHRVLRGPGPRPAAGDVPSALVLAAARDVLASTRGGSGSHPSAREIA
jgi:ADP-heptose:LPS heptosyltransferase